MILRIAVRNLFQHRSKSLIIGSLIVIGISLTLIFNSLVDSLVSTVERSFVENYTGDILVTSNETMGAGVFGAQSDDVSSVPVVPLLKDYEAALGEIRARPELTGVTRQMSGYAMLNFEEKGMDFSLFFGIEPDDYFSVMQGVRVLEGRKLQAGEDGMMLHVKTRDRIRKDLDLDLSAGSLIQLNSFGNTGFKIKEVPVVGVFEFSSGNDRFFTPSFVDVKTLRYLAGRFGGVIEKVQVGADKTALLDAGADLDALFGDGATADSPPAAPSSVRSTDPAVVPPSAAPSPASGSLSGGEGGGWNFILAVVAPGADTAKTIADLNAAFDAKDTRARAQGWKESASPDSFMYAAVKIVLNAAIGILAIVTIIIIMNTLVVSVMERTGEIGTMRALGTKKSKVTALFVAETTVLTVFFGLVGLIVGSIVVLVLGAAGIPTSGNVLSFLGGGLVIRPRLEAGPFLIALGLLAFISLVSWIIPVRMALRVSPLKAISTE